MSTTFRMIVVAAFMAASSGLAPTGMTQQATPDFGDDTSAWANDDECDDKRFSGPGMTSTPLLAEDIGHDATDCRNAWLAGDLQLASTNVPDFIDGMPEFGDDEGEWALDDECDDPRFAGPGMTNTPLMDVDIGHDATDCRDAWLDGNLRLTDDDRDDGDTPDFGDDEGEWALDDECDDPRFVGPGMTDTPLMREDRYHDATDCRIAWEDGDIELR